MGGKQTRKCVATRTTFVAVSIAARMRTLTRHMVYNTRNQYNDKIHRDGGGTGRFAVVTDTSSVGSRFSAIAGEMSHLETIPALDVFGIAGFLAHVSLHIQE